MTSAVTDPVRGAPLLVVRGVTKSFGCVQALRSKRAKQFPRRDPRILLSLSFQWTSPASLIRREML
jgi:hypothetical protein